MRAYVIGSEPHETDIIDDYLDELNIPRSAM